MKRKNYKELLDPTIFYLSGEVNLNDYGLSNEGALVLKNYKVFNDYKTRDLVTIKTWHNEKQISTYLLNQILYNKALFMYVLDNIDKENGIGVNLYYIDGNNINSIQYSTVEIIEGLKQYCKNNPEYQAAFQELDRATSLNTLMSNVCNKEYTCILYDKPITYSKHVLLNLLNYGDEELKKLWESSKEEIEHKICALISYIETEHIKERFYLDSEMVERYYNIASNNIIDINKYKGYIKTEKSKKVTEDTLAGIELNEDLIDLGSFNSYGLSDMEYAMILYIKLCKALNYDQNFFIQGTNNYGVNFVSLINNDVSEDCFIAIYGKLLKNAGIDISIIEPLSITDYINTLRFKDNEYEIEVTVTPDDMYNAKIDQPLYGFKCISELEITRKKCEELFNKHYEKYNKDNKKEEIEIDEKKYMNTFIEPFLTGEELSDENKIYLEIMKGLDSKLIGYESIRYQESLFNEILSRYPDGFTYTFVGTNSNDYYVPDKLGKKKFSTTLATIVAIKCANGEYNYYEIDANHPFILKSDVGFGENIGNKLTKELISKKFAENEYRLLDGEINNIPGVEIENDKTLGLV